MPDLSPLVSAVMPVYNAAAYLEEAISSILGQTFGDFEFVIVDDGSTDGGSEILDRASAAECRIRVLRQPNRGLIASLNRGCRAARGKYIARMDADDVALPTRFARQVEALEGNERLGVVGSAHLPIGAGGELLGPPVRYPTEDGEIRSTLRTACCFAHPTIMMRREAFLEVGGYRSAYVHAEDYDLFLRLAERWEMSNLEEALVRYRVHSGQVSSNHVRQQFTSALGAQLAARARSEGRADPTADMKVVTPEFLARHGADLDALERTVIRGYARWARQLDAASRGEAALGLVESGLATVAKEWKYRGPLAELHRTAATLYLKRGRWRMAARSGLAAALLHPRALPELARALRVAAGRRGET